MAGVCFLSPEITGSISVFFACVINISRKDVTMTEQQQAAASPAPATVDNYRRRFILGFGLFLIFFVFYMGTAIIQTPTFRDVAAIPCWGMPLGMVLSLAVFPVSWLLITIYFLRWR